MLKPNYSPDEEPKEKPEDEPAAPKTQGPSLSELMMLVFSVPLRLDDTDDTNEAEIEWKAEG